MWDKNHFSRENQMKTFDFDLQFDQHHKSNTMPHPGV